MNRETTTEKRTQSNQRRPKLGFQFSNRKKKGHANYTWEISHAAAAERDSTDDHKKTKGIVHDCYNFTLKKMKMMMLMMTDRRRDLQRNLQR